MGRSGVDGKTGFTSQRKPSDIVEILEVISVHALEMDPECGVCTPMDTSI